MENIITCPFCSYKNLDKNLDETVNCDGCGVYIISEIWNPSDLKPKMEYFGGKEVDINHIDGYEYIHSTWFIKKEDYSRYMEYENDDTLYNKDLNKLITKDPIIIPYSNFNYDDPTIVTKDQIKIIIDRVVSRICLDFSFSIYLDKYEIKDTVYNGLFLISLFDNIYDWLKKDEDYSNYYDTPEYKIGEYVGEFLTYYVFDNLKIDDFDLLNDEQQKEYYEIEDNLNYFIPDILKNIKPIQAYKYEDYIEDYPITNYEKMLEIRREESKIRDEKLKLNSENIWNQHFPELKKLGKITKDKGIKSGFFSKLEEVKKILSNDELEAIKRHTFKNDVSNSVYGIINDILRSN